MTLRFTDLLARADADPAVRAVVVTGAGRGFCAGADFTVLADAQADPTVLAPPEGWHADVILGLGVPVIAAVNGPAAGLGFAMMLHCDLRFAAAGAKLTTSFARRGLVAEYGSAWLLPRLIGVANALDLLLSARTITAEEGRELGLVQHVVPAGQVLAAAQDYARELVTWSSPRSMALIRRQVYGSWERPRREQFDLSMAMMLESFTQPDVVEGVRAHLERTAPAFPPYTPLTQEGSL
jgi:enoyl-CoA hydratase/carnithine racemase